MTTPAQNTIHLLLPSEVISKSLVEYRLIETRLQHFLESIKFFVDHIGVVINPDESYFAFASESDNPVDGFIVVPSSALNQDLYQGLLPPYALVPNVETKIGSAFSEFMQELTSMHQDCCLALLETFLDFDNEISSKLRGSIHLLEDSRLFASINYKNAPESAVLEMINAKGINITQCRISGDIAESLAKSTEASYGF